MGCVLHSSCGFEFKIQILYYYKSKLCVRLFSLASALGVFVLWARLGFNTKDYEVDESLNMNPEATHYYQFQKCRQFVSSPTFSILLPRCH